MPDNFYARTDRAIDVLNRRAIQRFKNAQKQASLAKFDELTVITTTKKLYDDLAQDNREIFEELAKEQYEATQPHGEETPDLTWLLALLLAYNATLHVIYENEVLRKRDYTIEAVNSSTAKATEFKAGLMKWSRFTGWYSVEVTDAATLKAFEDAGVKEIVWHTQEDGKVCKICRERNNEKYPIHKIPPKPHPNCRCWYSAVVEDRE